MDADYAFPYLTIVMLFYGIYNIYHCLGVDDDDDDTGGGHLLGA